MRFGARAYQQAFTVERRIPGAAPPPGADSFTHHGEADQPGDAGRGGAGAEKEEALFGNLLLGETQGGSDAGQRLTTAVCPFIQWLFALPEPSSCSAPITDLDPG